MRVLVLGAGLMGAQIGCEYALGEHEVALIARRPERVEERVAEALRKVREHGLRPAEDVDAALGRITIAAEAQPGAWELVVESLPEDLRLKAELLRPLAEGSPGAILASNTSSLRITDLGDAVGAPERTLGTHYWNPPLLMPLVEVIAGERTERSLVERIAEVLVGLGKRPVRVERDVPGFVWNRLQMAILREAVWIVEHGVATPDTIDDVLTYGLARRWRNIGFFKAIALGGVDTWQKTSANLLPALSTAAELPDLRQWTDEPGALADVAAARDRGLVRDLIEERKSDDRR